MGHLETQESALKIGVESKIHCPTRITKAIAIMPPVTCDGRFCPICNNQVIPGLDFCYCQRCGQWQPTQYHFDEINRQLKKKQLQQRIKQSKKKQDKDSLGLLKDYSQIESISHHDYENSYE